MPVKQIVTDPKQLSKPCKETTLGEAKPVIQDLMDTANAHKKNCAGLAANQIGSDLHVIVVKIKGKFLAFVNPKYQPASGKMESIEGCLSFPDSPPVKVMRYKMITTSAPKGRRKKLILKWHEAIAFQHECDHLNGIII